MPKNKSKTLYAKACQYIPGGVNSPVRAFKSVGGTPLFIQSAQGATLEDADGNRYIDYVGSWGAMIVGHAHPEVLDVMQQTAKNGLSFGAPCALEIALAEQISLRLPVVEMVRMVNSGTEAVMSALRLARAYTKRDKIIKFEGAYHGHSDSLLAQAGSGMLTCSIPTSPGVPRAVTQDTLLAPYNDAQAVTDLFKKHGNTIAAVIVEPIAGNMGFVRAQKSFLEHLRQCCDYAGSLLLFDEVMSGFRVALNGAQELYGVRPDLLTLGKVIGGGLPIGAFGGRKDIMSMVAPQGPVYQAGTLSGNPVAMAVGLKTIEIISHDGVFDRLANTTKNLCDTWKHIAQKAQLPFACDCEGGMFGFFMRDGLPQNLDEVKQAEQDLFSIFHSAMLEQGVYFCPFRFRGWVCVYGTYIQPYRRYGHRF